MADLNACAEAKNGDIITPQGRICYAQNMTEGQEGDNDSKLRYACTLIFPPSANLTLLKKKMAEIALEKCDGDKEKAAAEVAKRFKEALELDKTLDADEYGDWIGFRTGGSTMRPSFVYANGKRVPDENRAEDVYSGRWGRVSVSPAWFVFKNKQGAVMNRGVTAYLQNVQLLDHDDPFGAAKPRAEDQFEAVVSEGATSSETTADSLFD